MHHDRPLAVIVLGAGLAPFASDDQAASNGRPGWRPVPHRGGVVGDRGEHARELLAGEPAVNRGDDPEANGGCDEVVDDAGARDGSHRMRDGASRGGEGVLDGAGGLVVVDPARPEGSGTRAGEAPERGDGERPRAGPGEQREGAGLRWTEGVLEPGAEQEADDEAASRTEEQKEDLLVVVARRGKSSHGVFGWLGGLGRGVYPAPDLRSQPFEKYNYL